ncbi:MAG TPA: rhamnulose-1-phosphate aldolase [Bacteroidales bacterium]|nr:rhamnulose-1-phosphate aldolase [Bacteroidales bacterium]
MKEAILANKRIQKKILEVAELAQYLWQRGWAERNAGNISVNLTELVDSDVKDMNRYPVFELANAYPHLAEGYFFVTGTGKRMRDLARNAMKNACIIKMNSTGNQYHIISKNKRNLYDFRTTSELPTHLAIHNALVMTNSPNRAVVHTHPNELVALTQIKEFQDEKKLNKLLWGMHPESMVFVPNGMALVPYILPGTTKIANATLERIVDHDIVMWEKHGTFAVGETVFDAFDMIDIMSKSARIYFMVRQAGFEPEGLTDAQLDELKEAFHKK